MGMRLYGMICNAAKTLVKVIESHKIVILQGFENNEKPGEEMFAIAVDSIAVREGKIKQSLAGYFLQKTDRPQPGNLGKGYSGWNHVISFPRTVVPTALLEGFNRVLIWLRTLLTSGITFSQRELLCPRYLLPTWTADWLTSARVPVQAVTDTITSKFSATCPRSSIFHLLCTHWIRADNSSGFLHIQKLKAALKTCQLTE